MKYKGLIFDFNGVLLWDGILQQRAYDAMAQKLRGKPFTPEEIETYLHGRNTKDVLTYIANRPLEKEELDMLESEKEQLYMKLAVESPDMYHLSKGAEDLLKFLMARHIPHTIATASPKLLVDFHEKHLQLSQWFDLEKIMYNDYTFPGKPAPDIYTKAAEKIGLRPADCIVIEDARSGIAAAHAAGIGYIIAIGPQETHEDLRKVAGVDEVVTDLSEVKKEALF